MDKEALVKHLHSIISDYLERGQTFSLVMLIPVDPDVLDSKYTLIVSAHWLDVKSPKDAINLILTDFIKKIGSTNSPEYLKIARVTVIRTDDPFVMAITSAFSVNQSDVTLNNCNINGVLIERAILLESRRPTVTPGPSGHESLKKVGRSGKKSNCCAKSV